MLRFSLVSIAVALICASSNAEDVTVSVNLNTDETTVEYEILKENGLEGGRYVLHNLTMPLTIQCNVTENVANPMFSWYKVKDGMPEVINVEEDESKYSVSHVNRSLTIKKLTKDDLGEYQCLMEKDGMKYNRSVNVDSEPFFEKKHSKSKNLVQGDPLTLDCKAWGVPLPDIYWYKGSDLLMAGGRVSFSDYQGLNNGTLRIEDLDFDDRDDYMCAAVNTYGNNTQTTLVRVKDKLAALWPFLGICAEVAILCLIIFIYEKRRAKKMEQMEREEADHLTNSHNNKNDDVRQRRV